MVEIPKAPKIDEFVFVLLAGVILIFILTITWSTPTELVPIVEPKSVSVDVREGGTATFDLAFNGTASSVNLTATGEIKYWMTFSKNNFDFSGLATVRVTVDVPDGKDPGTYRGTIGVKTPGGEKNVQVAVNVLKMTEEVSRRIVPLGDFTVSYTSGMDELDSKSGVSAVNGYFTNAEVTLVGILSSEKLGIITDGYIQLIVEEANQAGNLVVVFNGKELYNQPAGLGELLIPISKEAFGRSNSVVIRAGSPGWKFWMNTIYKFRLVRLVANYKGAFSKQASFELAKGEIDNFKDFNLFYRVREYTSPLPALMIKIDSQIVFWESPPFAFFDSKISKDMFGNALYLEKGNNTITFLFEKEASYNVADALLTVETYKYVSGS